jgi:hypothetical protein
VVSGLCLYTAGRQQSPKGKNRPQHVHNIFGQRVLARRELDVHSVGSVSRGFVFTVNPAAQKSKIHKHRRGGKIFAERKRTFSDSRDVFISACRVDIFQVGEYWASR